MLNAKRQKYAINHKSMDLILLVIVGNAQCKKRKVTKSKQHMQETWVHRLL